LTRAQGLRNERGQTLAEFALVLPLLGMLLFGIVQFGIVFNNYLTLTDAVRAGARKAVVSRHLGDRVTVTKTAVKSSATGLPLTDDRIEVDSVWTPGSDVTVSASYPYSIDLLGLVVQSGDLKSTSTERVE
jgi:Flp pilus assembly protein TadG